MRRAILHIILILSATATWAQEQRPLPDSTDLSNLSIEELSRLRSRYAATEMEKSISSAIEAASRKPLPMRRSPSIVSVITANEIEKSGARDLMDVLTLVPGFEFNVDVEGVVAISFRGLWSNEGNISLQIDGQEVNEIAYASLQFGNHYSLGMIKKIEIIRGPGSSIHGGCAEYAVINIITRKGEDIKGIEAQLNAGQTATTFARRGVSLAAGNKVKDLSYAIYGTMSRAQRSDGEYTDAYGTNYPMPGNATLDNRHLNVSASYKDLSVRLMYDNYSTTNRDGDLTALSRAYPLDFMTCMAEVKYNHQVTKKARISLKLGHKYSEPWSFSGQPDPVDSTYFPYLLKANSVRGNAGLMWDPRLWLNTNFGIEAYNDRGRLGNDAIFRTDSTDHVSYMNIAPYAQLLFRSTVANVTVGARYDISTAFGQAFNPRLGITKLVGMFNFKLLYASSFRAPAIESIQYGIDKMKLKPERSKTLEFEVSAKIRKDMYLSLNAFDISTRNAIRYFVNTDTSVTYYDGYRNSDQLIGSQGFELEYKYRSTFGFANIAYSFYTVQNKDVDASNSVPGDNSVTLGTAKHKLSISGSVDTWHGIYISPSLSFLDKRYAYASVDSMENGILSTLSPQTVLGLFIGSNDLVKNMSLGVGVHNITNEQILYPQAYDSYHAPLPGMGREYYIRMSYRIPFKQQQ